MRLVVDLQACQTDSRDRGIGRYAMSLVQAIASELDESDELILAIDMADARRARDVRNELRHRRIPARTVGYSYPATAHSDTSRSIRRLAGQLRSRFYTSLRPDVLLIASLFETGTPCSTELDWKVLEGIHTAVVGYDLIPLLFPERYLLEGHFVTGWYKARLNDLLRFDLILSISEATKRDLIARLEIAEEQIAVIGAGFDETLACPYGTTDGVRRLRELGITRPFILMVGNGDWRKNTLGAVHAFAELPEEVRSSCELVLTQSGDQLQAALDEDYAHLRGQVRILGRVSDATLALLYRECHVFYFPSYYEGFGLPVLEAMAFGAPVLSSNAGSLPEVAHDPRILFDPRQEREGAALLAKILTDDQFREEIRRNAREHALEFTWARTAKSALRALRTLAQRSPREHGRSSVRYAWPAEDDIALMADAWLDAGDDGEQALLNGLRAICRGGERRVLVDITEIVRLDAGTGIQRVTRNFFAGLTSVAMESGRYQVEPFCWTEAGIHYAREFARNRLGVSCRGQDDSVQVQPSDLILMLDSSWWSPERFDDLHSRVHGAGGEVVWMVYDLIPIRFPETCNPEVLPAFRAWLTHAVRTTDGFVCISEATRQDLESFIHASGDADAPHRRPWTRCVHLGCDLDAAQKSSPSERVTALRASIGDRAYFVSLGTLEPRKDYATIIEAFESLWERGFDAVLMIVGKQGWNVDHLAERINHHPERGRRLFWVQGTGDGDVRLLLQGAAALIQASIWEGFGLPLVEAANLGVPLLVSDIAVFHEIAGQHAMYFPVGDSAALAKAAAATIAGRGAAKPAIRRRTWREASRDLADILGVT